MEDTKLFLYKQSFRVFFCGVWVYSSESCGAYSRCKGGSRKCEVGCAAKNAGVGGGVVGGVDEEVAVPGEWSVGFFNSIFTVGQNLEQFLSSNGVWRLVVEQIERDNVDARFVVVVRCKGFSKPIPQICVERSIVQTLNRVVVQNFAGRFPIVEVLLTYW